MSNFVAIPGHLAVDREEQEVIAGCSGFVVPRKEDEVRKKFKFGR